MRQVTLGLGLAAGGLANAVALAQAGGFRVVDLPEAPVPVLTGAAQAESVQTRSAQAGAGAAAGVTASTSRVSGDVVDAAGAAVAGAQIALMADAADGKVVATTTTGPDGSFELENVPAGAYVLRVKAIGFADGRQQLTVAAIGAIDLPQVKLAVAGVTADVEVTLTRQEIAQEQIQQQEKQRVFGVIPNFYVSYERDPVPLTTRQKYQLAWRSIIDPTSFLFTGIAAGIEQATETFPGYGQGAAGYGKRYGAGFGDLITGTMIGGAILPSLLKQDPRYFYQGTGSVKSRAWHAISRAVVCRGDNGKTQVDYSGILGGLAAAGISNAYYPAQDRNGAGVTFANFGIGFGTTAAANLFQEFLVKKLSRGVPPGANGSGPQGGSGN